MFTLRNTQFRFLVLSLGKILFAWSLKEQEQVDPGVHCIERKVVWLKVTHFVRLLRKRCFSRSRWGLSRG